MTSPNPRNQLQDMGADRAVQMYLDDRQHEVSDATYRAHKHRLQRFLDWCESEDVSNLNELTGRDVQAYKIHRRKDGIAKTTLKTQMDTFRVFLSFCERIDAVVEGLSESVDSPKIGKKEGTRDDIVETEKAQQILDYFHQFHYASVKHTLFALLWDTGVRVGTVHTIDVGDVELDEQFVSVSHSESTPLKNKENGERPIALTESTATIVGDYIQHNRFDNEEENGRRPLLTTTHGRASKNCLRSYVYQMTRPCVYSGNCPVGEDPEECRAKNRNTYAYECPESTSTHSVRRGSITHHLSEDVPSKVVSDRMDVSQEVLEKHYDSRSEQNKMEQRREYLEDI